MFFGFSGLKKPKTVFFLEQMDALNCSIFMNYQHHKDRKLRKKSFSKIFFAGIWGKKASKLKNVFGNTFFSNQFVTLRY